MDDVKALVLTVEELKSLLDFVECAHCRIQSNREEVTDTDKRFDDTMVELTQVMRDLLAGQE